MAKRPKKLLDQVRDAIRLKHYAYSTEQTYVDCTQMGPGVKHQPEATSNGHTERGNPSRALSALALSLSKGCAGAGDQAACRDGVGCPKPVLSQAEGKLMPGVTPWRWYIARYADVGRVTGKARVLAQVEL